MKFRNLLGLTLYISCIKANAPFSVPLQNGIGPTDDLILFDAPAFPDPSKPGEYLVDQPTFVYEGRDDSFSLSSFEDEAAQKRTPVRDRLKLFMTVGLPDKSTSLYVSNCSWSPNTGFTDSHGVSLARISLGACGTTRELTGTANLEPFDKRRITNTIFLSPDSGFGVISDVDDTIKISNVLHRFELLKNTFLVDPLPVPGIPELYASLSKSLGDPQFVYISASPFKLYPFLNNFIDTTYSASKGPILLQNVSLTNVNEVITFLTSEQKIFEYKFSQIVRLQNMYPNKKWLAIGDSTQKDPETYGEAFRKFPGFIACIWIRLFDGANNTDARFRAAFAGVPANKFHLFTDDEIPKLSDINVAAGNC